MLASSANKSHLNTAWRPCEVRWLFSRTICAMNLLRDFYSQTHTQSCCFHHLGIYTNPPPPVPPFLLTLNQSLKEIAGSDITNCLTHTMAHFCSYNVCYSMTSYADIGDLSWYYVVPRHITSFWSLSCYCKCCSSDHKYRSQTENWRALTLEQVKTNSIP